MSTSVWWESAAAPAELEGKGPAVVAGAAPPDGDGAAVCSCGLHPQPSQAVISGISANSSRRRHRLGLGSEIIASPGVSFAAPALPAVPQPICFTMFMWYCDAGRASARFHWRKNFRHAQKKWPCRTIREPECEGPAYCLWRERGCLRACESRTRAGALTGGNESGLLWA